MVHDFEPRSAWSDEIEAIAKTRKYENTKMATIVSFAVGSCQFK